MQIIRISVGGRGGRGNRDKERDQKPLTKEALDADLDEVYYSELADFLPSSFVESELHMVYVSLRSNKMTSHISSY